MTSRPNRLLGLLLAIGFVVLGGCADPDGEALPPPQVSPSPTAASPTVPSPTGCAGTVTTAPLPTWARAGFSPPSVDVTYVQGARGDIVGVLFGQPLTSPPYPRGRQNKILWVARVSGVGPLRIAAHLMNSDVAVVRHVRGGPGPSIIDLPAAGCWRFDLTWSGYSDQVYVAYEKRERPSERNLA